MVSGPGFILPRPVSATAAGRRTGYTTPPVEAIGDRGEFLSPRGNRRCSGPVSGT